MKLNTQLTGSVKEFVPALIPEERKAILQQLINYIQVKVSNGEAVNLNFICTHNSRRSQLAQVWAQTAAYAHGVEVKSFSGGVEVTAFNERAVEALKRAGFRVTTEGNSNPVYHVFYADEAEPVRAFSKLYDNPINPTSSYAVVMTCAHADENCPFIPGAEARIPVRYDDPKAYDNTPLEGTKYDERSWQIAGEMFYVFSKIQRQ